MHDSVDAVTYYSGLRRSLRRTAGEALERYGFDAALVTSVMKGNGHSVIPASLQRGNEVGGKPRIVRCHEKLNFFPQRRKGLKASKASRSPKLDSTAMKILLGGRFN